MLQNNTQPLTIIALVIGLVLGGWGTAGNAQADAHNLISAGASPYLAQHIADPIRWRTWGADALSEAKLAGKPIFLSIGYSACHWCHVMQRENFTDPVIAALINKNFVPVLIDREAMPGIDAAFQEAAAAGGFPTGWPLNLFLTPDGKLFWGSGYLPDEARGGLPSFGDVATGAIEAFAAADGSVEDNAHRIERRLQARIASTVGDITPQRIDADAERLYALSDPFDGGFETAPKFPNVEALELLWRAYIRTGDGKFRDAVTLAFDNMLAGGLYDHVGGGFFRYTVDAHWQTPHFEKMLDVNAQMLGLMVEVWRETRSPSLARAIAETAAFLLNELRLEGGGFAASLNADSRNVLSEEEDGAYYSWSRAEIDAMLGGDAERFWRVFRLEPMEGRVLEDAKDRGVLMQDEGWNADRDFALDALSRLRAHRALRDRPRRDEKVLSDWNAYAVRALAAAGATFGRNDWSTAASEAFAFCVTAMSEEDGRLAHFWYAGRRGGTATLDDLAAMAMAAVILSEMNGDEKWSGLARLWLDFAEAHYGDAATGGYFATADDGPLTPVRIKPVRDSASASGNAQMIEALVRLYHLHGDDVLRARAQRTLLAVAGSQHLSGPRGAGLVNAVETLHASLQVVVIGQRTDHNTKALIDMVYASSAPTLSLLVILPGAILPLSHPAYGKVQVDGIVTAYVCRGSVCALPVSGPKALSETLRTFRRDPDVR